MRKTLIFCVTTIASVSIVLEGASGQDTRVYNTIYQEFCTVPPFDTVSGDVLNHPDLDSTVYSHLNTYDCDSLVRCFPQGMGAVLDRWYRACFPTDIDVDALSDSLIGTADICQVDVDDTSGLCMEESYAPSDSAWQDQEYLFRLLGLDSAIDLVNQFLVPDSVPSIGLLHYGNVPIEWGHPDLRDNMWINSGEDLNNNGVLDPWRFDVDSNGVLGDFNGQDDDGNGWIDDLIGSPYDTATIKAAENAGHGHETPAAGIAAAVSDNGIGISGICPECDLASARGGLVHVPNLARKGILSFSYAYGTNTPGLCDYVRLPKVTSSVFHFLDSLGGRFFRSAGNGYYEYEQSYAREPSVLVVAAFDYSVDSADPTNFRRVSMYHETVDFCLPGEWPATATGGGYTPRFSYTSASTPAMAGIFGLMRYYDMCNDSISWTSDEIVARLKASCTSLESVWGDDPIRPAVGKLGAGYPNVYHAMTMDSLVFVDLSAEPLMFPDSVRSLSSLVSPGDTLMIRYAVTASGSVSDTIWIEPYSQDASITVVGGTTMIDSVALDSTYFDSLTFAIPSSTEPGTCVRVCLVVTDSADYADTVSLEALVLTPRAQWSLSRANSVFGKVLTYAINYGNTDDDGNPEAVFYLVDSLYCVDLENGEVESGFPIPVSIPYDSPIQSVLSPALGDLDGDGIDEIIYRPSAFQVAAVDGTGVTVSGWSAKWVGSSGLAPVVSDVEGDGNVEVVVLGDDSLYVLSSTGAPIDGYPIPISGDRTSSQPCIGDIDGDGNKEVCFITTEGLKVRTLSSTTSVFSHSEVHNSGDLKLADTDHDARLELLVASDTDSNGESYLLVIGTNDSGIYCIEDTLFDEWGTGFLRPINPTFPFVGLDAFSLADLSNDGFAEVVSPVLPSQCAGAPKIVYFDGSGNVQDLLDSTALLSCLSTEEPEEVFPVGGIKILRDSVCR